MSREKASKTEIEEGVPIMKVICLLKAEKQEVYLLVFRYTLL